MGMIKKTPRMIEVEDELRRLEADGPPKCAACKAAEGVANEATEAGGGG